MALPRAVSIAIPATRHSLEGRLRQVDGARELAIVAPPHPLYGGTIGNPVVHAIEHAFNDVGVSTLAFNFRGTGESSGEPSAEPQEALVDYCAAAQSVVELQPTWLSGYSFGGVAALTTAIELDVPHVLIVGPPLGLLDPALPPRYRGQLAIAVGDDDEYAPLEALREVFASHPAMRLEVVEGVDHFFLGSDVQKLSTALAALLRRGPAT